MAAGGGSHGDHGYTWIMHAASVWKVTRDRSRTLALLREARDRDPRDLTSVASAESLGPGSAGFRLACARARAQKR
jgi:hypothetical protein